MNTALFASPDLLAPLHSLWRWLMPTQTPGQTVHPAAPAPTREFATTNIASHASRSCAIDLKHLRDSSTKPLRVVRILESGACPAHVGRLVISGRMADVCAELDRLVAREAACH
jgi:hypothetical protein